LPKSGCHQWLLLPQQPRIRPLGPAARFKHLAGLMLAAQSLHGETVTVLPLLSLRLTPLGNTQVRSE
jgi:hypothetical protein